MQSEKAAKEVPAEEVYAIFDSAIEQFSQSAGGPGAYEALQALEKAERLAGEKGLQLPEDKLADVRSWGAHPGVEENLFSASEYSAGRGDVDSTVKFLYLVEQAAHWGKQELDRERVRVIKKLLQSNLQAKELDAQPN